MAVEIDKMRKLFKICIMKNVSDTGAAVGEDRLSDSTNHCHIHHNIDSQRKSSNSQTSRRRCIMEHSVRGRRLSFNSSSDAVLLGEEELKEEEARVAGIALPSMQPRTSTKDKMIAGLKGGQSRSPSNCWKWAFDEKTKKRYFYNKITREVTWVKPKEFNNEWKVYCDRSTDRCYYYNTRTKETTWNQPQDFALKQQSFCEEQDINLLVEDAHHTEHRTAHHAPILMSDSQTLTTADSTRGESMENHSRVKEVEEVHVKQIITTEKEDVNSTSFTNYDNHPDPWRAYFDYTTKRHFYYNFITKEKTWTKPRDFQEWIAVESTSCDKENYYYNVLTGVSSWMNPSMLQEESTKKEQPSTDSTKSKAKLQDLTMKYCPDEIYYTQRMFRKFKGCERIPLQAIQLYTENGNAPFDEQNLTVKSFVKAAVTPSGSEPYDEIVDRGLSNNSLLTTKRIPKKSRKIETKTTADDEEFPNPSPSFSSTSVYSRYLSKPIHLVGSSGRTATYMYR